MVMDINICSSSSKCDFRTRVPLCSFTTSDLIPALNLGFESHFQLVVNLTNIGYIPYEVCSGLAGTLLMVGRSGEEISSAFPFVRQWSHPRW